MINSLAVLPDGRLASCSNDAQSIEIWNVNNGTLSLKLNGHSSKVNVLLLIKDFILVSGSEHGIIKLWKF